MDDGLDYRQHRWAFRDVSERRDEEELATNESIHSEDERAKLLNSLRLPLN